MIQFSKYFLQSLIGNNGAGKTSVINLLIDKLQS